MVDQNVGCRVSLVKLGSLWSAHLASASVAR
jgi:hypothetical protein